MDRFKAVEKEIEEIISKSPVETDVSHARLTRKWLLELNPDADEAFQIAALAHDMERGITGKLEIDMDEKYDDYDNYKKQHSERSAKVIRGILEKHGFNEDFIKRVERLVLLHEFGGDEESDILIDADSIAFFEEKIKIYLKRYGKEKTRFKVKFMYDRMSERAKGIVREFEYDDPELDSVFKEVIS